MSASVILSHCALEFLASKLHDINIPQNSTSSTAKFFEKDIQAISSISIQWEYFSFKRIMLQSCDWMGAYTIADG